MNYQILNSEFWWQGNVNIKYGKVNEREKNQPMTKADRV